MISTVLESLATVGRFIYAYKLALRCAKDLYKIYNGTIIAQDGHDGHEL